MFKLGVTGGIGSGKTTVTDMFAEFGIQVVDADIVAREVVEPGTPCLDKIADHFGSEILLANGELNRSVLRNLIFSNPDEKNWLEALLHPAIRKEIIKQLAAADSSYSILASPLIFETNQGELVDRVALVDIPENMQRQRAASRDASNEEAIQKIIDAQMSREKKLALTDDLIDNSGDLENTKTQVLELHKKYLEFGNL